MQKTGISDQIYSLLNEIQIRPTTNIIVTKCTAKYYIENSKPNLENLVTKYYDIFPNSSEYTGYVCNATIGDFFSNLNCNNCEPYTILGGLTPSGKSSSTSSTLNGDFKSNETPVEGNRSTENIGIAVFKNDKLVGELNAIETICFQCFKNPSQSFLISIPSPEDENYYLDIYLNLDKLNKITIDTSGNNPFIKINISFAGKIYSMSNHSDYLNEENLKIIQNDCNNYLKLQFSNFLYKTSTDFKSDVCGLGKYALSNFYTNSDFNNYNWLENYKDAIFDLNINTNIDSSFLLNRT